MVSEKLQNARSFFRKINPNLFFVAGLLLLAILYEYPSILGKRPQSVHKWRQSDCASLASIYYQTGMHFFQPQTHNLTSNDKTTGHSATSEIPLEYYLIASLYKVFGQHEFIFRLVNTLIFFTGLFYLFKSFRILSKSTFWSVSLTLFFFTSPVLVYYGNNFLTDSSALAFSFIGWYYFLKFYTSHHQPSFYWSMAFLLLAGASKVSSLISLVVIAGVFLAEITGVIRFKKENKIFTKPWWNALGILMVFGIITAWVIYAKVYNSRNGSGYFSTTIFPLWSMNATTIREVGSAIREVWMYQYFSIYGWCFVVLALILSVFFVGKADRMLLTSTVFMMFGTVLFVILWYSTLQYHDYYVINLFIWPVIIVMNLVWVVRNHFPAVFSSLPIKVVFLIFLILNVIHARNKVNERYEGFWNEYPATKDFHTVTPYLRSIGIAPLDTVVSIPDESHFTLYLMNQLGWTECGGLNGDSTSLALSISKGANYLIIDEDQVKKRDYLKSFIRYPLGKYNRIMIFKLDECNGSQSQYPEH